MRNTLYEKKMFRALVFFAGFFYKVFCRIFCWISHRTFCWIACGFCFVSCSHVKDKVILPLSNSKSSRSAERILADASKRVSVFSEGVALFQKGQLSPARLRLETLNHGDPRFVSGLLEIQKINYIKNEWDRFFGLAVYYRSILLFSGAVDKISASHFRQEFLALEVLALVRHCRFRESKKLVKWSVALANKLKKDSSKIKKTVYFLNLDNFFGDQKQSKNKVKWKNKIHWWPLATGQLQKIDNPKSLRLRMDSQC